MPEKYTPEYLDKAAASILSLQHKMPDGTVCDADTVLADILDNMETEVTGAGFELIELYQCSTDKPGFCRLFEALTGTTWTAFIEESLRVMTKTAEPTMGEWLDVQVEELYVPDKHFTTYHTAQTCSACGVRTKFVGEAPFTNDQYCPVCGKPMKKQYVFNHHPQDGPVLHGFTHAGSKPVSNTPVTHVPFEPKNINEIYTREYFHKPESLE